MLSVQLSYSSLQDMYERYSIAAKRIKLEGHIYRFIGVRRKIDHSIHLYHCEKERHYIIVYLKYSFPVLIKPIYSVDAIDLTHL